MKSTAPLRMRRLPLPMCGARARGTDRAYFAQTRIVTLRFSRNGCVTLVMSPEALNSSATYMCRPAVRRKVDDSPRLIRRGRTSGRSLFSYSRSRKICAMGSRQSFTKDTTCNGAPRVVVMKRLVVQPTTLPSSAPRSRRRKAKRGMDVVWWQSARVRETHAQLSPRAAAQHHLMG